MQIRTITIKDYPKLISFWKENYFVSDMDSLERFKLFLGKNPELSIVMEEEGSIIGTALGSFDGRRGYLQKLVTDKTQRKKGIGKSLVDEVIRRLQKLGVLYIPISCESNNVAFYKKCGFNTTKQVSMSIKL